MLRRGLPPSRCQQVCKAEDCRKGCVVCRGRRPCGDASLTYKASHCNCEVGFECHSRSFPRLGGGRDTNGTTSIVIWAKHGAQGSKTSQTISVSRGRTKPTCSVQDVLEGIVRPSSVEIHCNRPFVSASQSKLVQPNLILFVGTHPHVAALP